MTTSLTHHACHLELPYSDHSHNTYETSVHMQYPSEFSTHSPPFQHDPSLTIVALYFGVEPWYNSVNSEHFVLLIPVSTLLHQLDLAHQRLANGEGLSSRSVPWDAWGPLGSRLIKTPHEPDFSTLGSKFAAAFYDAYRRPDEPRTANVCVVDVNPSAPASGWKDDYIDCSEEIVGTRTFPRGVKTTYPCTVTRHTVVMRGGIGDFRLVLFHDGWALVSTASVRGAWADMSLPATRSDSTPTWIRRFTRQ